MCPCLSETIAPCIGFTAGFPTRLCRLYGPFIVLVVGNGSLGCLGLLKGDKSIRNIGLPSRVLLSLLFGCSRHLVNGNVDDVSVLFQVLQ